MSYILDALKKSELERHSPAAVRPRPTVNASVGVAPRQAAPATNTRENRDERKISHWYWIIGGALLVNGGFTLFHHYNDPRHTGGPSQAQADTTAALAETSAKPNLATRAPQPVANTPASATPGDNAVPLLKDKPASYRHSVPKMNVDLHVYAQRPSERFALINMTKFREGEEIGRGLTLQEITPTGLIIAFQGESFRIDTRY